jgi:hypothetical protein
VRRIRVPLHESDSSRTAARCASKITPADIASASALSGACAPAEVVTAQTLELSAGVERHAAVGASGRQRDVGAPTVVVRMLKKRTS